MRLRKLRPAWSRGEPALPPAPADNTAQLAGPAPAVDELAKPAAALAQVAHGSGTNLDEAANHACPNQRRSYGRDARAHYQSDAPLLAAQSQAAVPAAVEEPK